MTRRIMAWAAAVALAVLFAPTPAAGSTAGLNPVVVWNSNAQTAIYEVARQAPAWMPLLVTPPFPDYTSGHTCSTAIIMAAMRAFFGRDDVPVSAYSADSGTIRSFPGFSAALDEVVEARIWGGVHFRTADVEGVKIGKGVARYVLIHEFQPRR